MAETLDRVPPHLRRYVIQQDYAGYTAVDQAVWRFVLLQMYAKLQHTAHNAYRDGLAQTGISVERIPSIREMNDCLGRYDWGAVCVDGFIPPRAFTEFQALGLLPICAEIRSSDHLVYTPAPDIIHEAAGHAPIIVDAKYAQFLKRIGEVGARAFQAPQDTAVYQAIFELSEVKERPGASREDVEAAERAFERAKQQARRVSEATRVSRLYWWTAEYGLIGTPSDYKLYGAGLLSSLGESHSCHDPSVRKLVLGPECVETGYDITQTQPQLFVAQDFEHLSEVLEQVADTLAYRTGGRQALLEAERSQELCTLTLESGLQVIGEIGSTSLAGAGASVTRFFERAALAERDKLLPEHRTRVGGQELWLVLGELADGASLVSQVARWASAAGSKRRETLRLGDTFLLSGTPLGRANSTDQVLRCEDLRLERGAELVAQAHRAQLVLSKRLEGARAGSVDPDYYEASGYSAQKAPKPHSFPPEERAMIQLYERALEAHVSTSPRAMIEGFEQIQRTLERDYPGDWLLRWNALESLLKRGYDGPLADRLHHELMALEHRYEGRQPIASGLRYLGFD